MHDDVDGGDSVAVVHAVSQVLSDIDLDQLAAEQPQKPVTRPDTSLVLQQLNIPGCTRKVWCDTSLSRVRFWVPPGWQRKVFRAVHDLSHPSGRTTLAILSRMYVWNGIRRDVLEWSRACDVCARSKVARHTHPPILAIQNPETRFEHIHVDLVGPFPC